MVTRVIMTTLAIMKYSLLRELVLSPSSSRTSMYAISSFQSDVFVF